MDMMIALQDKRLLRVDEAARILTVSRWTVYRWVEAGRLGGTRIGAGSLRIYSETVAALIELNGVGVLTQEKVSRKTQIDQKVQGLAGRQGPSHGRVRPQEHVRE